MQVRSDYLFMAMKNCTFPSPCHSLQYWSLEPTMHTSHLCRKTTCVVLCCRERIVWRCCMDLRPNLSQAHYGCSGPLCAFLAPKDHSQVQYSGIKSYSSQNHPDLHFKESEGKYRHVYFALPPIVCSTTIFHSFSYHTTSTQIPQSGQNRSYNPSSNSH